MDCWGYCYLFWYKDLNIYKIGFGKSAQKRLLQLQRTYPKPLHMVDSCRCYNPRLLEKQLHQKYGCKRQCKSEFFRLNDDDVVDILATFNRCQGTVIEKLTLTKAA